MSKLFAAALIRILGATLLVLGSNAICQDAEWRRSIDAGTAAMNKHEYIEAESNYRNALGLAEKHWHKDARISVALIRTAEACDAQAKSEEAERLAQRSLTSLDEALKAHKPRDASDELQQLEVAAMLSDRVGDLFARNHKYSQAEAAYQKVIAIREKYTSGSAPTKPNKEDFFRALAQNLPGTQTKLADANSKLAKLYCSEQKSDDAQSLFKKAVTLEERQFGPDQPQVAEKLSELANCYSQQGKYEQTEPVYKRVIRILEQSHFKDEAPMAVALENYGLLLRKISREAEAKTFIDRASAILARSGEASR